MIDDLLRVKNGVHGDFSVDANHAQVFKRIMRVSPNWERLTAVQQEALDHIATKIARILAGDPNHADHWRDIEGYARLVEQSLDVDPPVESAIGVLVTGLDKGHHDAGQGTSSPYNGRRGQGDQKDVAGG